MRPCTARTAPDRGRRSRRRCTQACAHFTLRPVAETVTSSPEETEALAAALATRLALGDVVTVAGELGTGKTTFVRGACSALGVRERVTSPTYTIGHRYHGAVGEVSHLDLYRFAGVSS